MTIVTQAVNDKNSQQQKEPLVPLGNVPSSPQDVEAGRPRQSGPAIPSAPRLMVRLQRNHRRSRDVGNGSPPAISVVFVFVLALMVFCAALMASFFFYQQYTAYRMRHFTGWCGVQYGSFQDRPEPLQTEPCALEREGTDGDGEEGDGSPPCRVLSDMSETALLNAYFNEQLDLDLDQDEYEQIDVPDFKHGRRGRFLHDFSKNITAIVDLDGSRCFLMELDREKVLPPTDFFQMVEKMKNGDYDVDTEVVRTSYRVQLPPLQSLQTQEVGSYITKECNIFPVFKLERMTSPVFKRSVPTNGEKTAFVEFAGKKVSQYDIVNLESAIGGRKDPVSS